MNLDVCVQILDAAAFALVTPEFLGHSRLLKFQVTATRESISNQEFSTFTGIEFRDGRLVDPYQLVRRILVAAIIFGVAVISDSLRFWGHNVLAVGLIIVGMAVMATTLGALAAFGWNSVIQVAQRQYLFVAGAGVFYASRIVAIYSATNH
jgi:hypothetical protein